MYSLIIKSNQLKSTIKVLNISLRELSQSSSHAQYTQTVDSKYIDKEWNSAMPYEKIPGPTKWDFIKGFAPGGKYSKLSLPQMVDMFQEDYGDIMKIPSVFKRPGYVFSFDPNDFEKVFRTEGFWPDRRGNETIQYYREKLRPELFEEYGGLITDQGEKWASLRTKVNPIMMQPKTVKLYVPVIDEIAREFAHKVRQERDNNNEVKHNFNEEINKWALESIGYIALDTRLNILNNTDPNLDSHTLVKCVRELFESIYELEIKPSIWKYYATPTFNRLMTAFDTITNLLHAYIDEAIKGFEANNKKSMKSEHEMGVLERLCKINRNAAVVMATDMMMAGIDTTASLVINFMYLLAKNPDKQQKLREEIMKIMPEKDTPLTMESLNNIIRACFKEVNRVYPIVSGNMRSAGSDLVLKGYQIPKGTNVAMQIMTMYSNDAVFPNAANFIPERWLKEGNDSGCPSAKTAHPFVYLPFGFGPRMCVGRRLAELETYAFIARMVRNFNIEWHHPDLKHKAMMVILPDGDMKFRFNDI